MNEFINVKIRKDEAIELLCNRVTYWSNNEEVVDLFKQMYERYLDDEVFDNLDIDVIVDNDFINDCSIIEKGDEDFEKIQELAKQGYYDISCETCHSFIEAYNEDYSLILVRY